MENGTSGNTLTLPFIRLIIRTNEGQCLYEVFSAYVFLLDWHFWRRLMIQMTNVSFFHCWGVVFFFFFFFYWPLNVITWWAAVKHWWCSRCDDKTQQRQSGTWMGWRKFSKRFDDFAKCGNFKKVNFLIELSVVCFVLWVILQSPECILALSTILKTKLFIF